MPRIATLLLWSGLSLTAAGCSFCSQQFSSQCENDGECPADYSCRAGVCVAHTADAGSGDAAGLDRSLTDLAAADAGGEDRADSDAALPDAWYPEGARPDALQIDTGQPDAGQRDSARPDSPLFDGGTGPALFAIHPPIAKAGDTIVLEGIFPAGSLTVKYAGILFQLATSPATSRLFVEVPGGAGSGPVCVVIDGVPSNAVPFRYTTFEPRLGYFSANYEQTVAAREMPRLPNPRAHGSAVATSRYLYLIGGSTEGITQQSTVRARIFADGTLGQFTDDLTHYLDKRRIGAATALIGNRVYILGGYNHNEGSTLKSVEYSDISVDGELTSFVAGPDLPDALQDAEAIAIGRYLYLIGGRHSDDWTASISEVIRAPIGSGFDLGPFEPAPSLLENRDRVAAAVVGGKLYVFGGTSANETAEWAPIDDNGNLGSFLPLNINFTPRRSAAVAVFPSELCLIGGEHNNAEISSVECADILPDDSLGSFGSRGALGVARASAMAALVHNHFYLLGGTDENESTRQDIVQAPINFGALFGGFVEQTSSALPYALRDPACAVVGGNLYLTGGKTGSVTTKAVHRFFVSMDGELSHDDSFDSELHQQLYGHRLAVTDQHLLVIAGANDYAWGRIAEIRATVISDGDPGWVWGANTTYISPAVSHFASAIAGSRLYVAGGSLPYGVTSAVQYMDLRGASPTNWTNLAQARAGVGTAVLGNSLYVVAGHDSLEYSLSSLEVAACDDTGLSGFALSSSNLDTDRSDPMVAVIGNALYVMGGYKYENRVTTEKFTIECADECADGSLAEFWFFQQHLPSEVSRGGCLVELGNYLHLIGGWDGVSSTRKHWAATLY
ncbi:MAG: hypothetical protein JXR83_11850 [Deltaproteobacteria bacterium]|nr:hypothetical protein [Deltaproteobacteria bacterium]